ncbi:MAG: exonuclease domain-containing protein [Bacteroides sp.]|nr:exonuclease domain-containing protein [Bacteroides sp.]
MDFVAIDFETANHNRSSACSIGIAVVKNNAIVDAKAFFIRPIPNYYAPINKQIHGISGKDTDSAPTFAELWNEELKHYLVGRDIVAHNAPFEKSVLVALSQAYDIDIPTDRLFCSLHLSRGYLDIPNYKLDNVCSALGIRFANHHNAKADAIGCAEIVLKIAHDNAIHNLEELFQNKARRSCLCQRDTLFDTNKISLEYGVCEDVIKGKVFCFTGTLSYIQRDIAQVIIEKAGGIFKKSMSSKVDYLVVGDLSLYGEDYESCKIKKVREYREKGSKIEILTEEQFQEFVVYEGPAITRETIDADSRALLDDNYANAFYGKGICLSEGFDNTIMSTLALLGAQMSPTYYEDEAVLTDYYIISNVVIHDLFDNRTKSPTVIRMESAMKKQLNPDVDRGYHRLKCISEDAIMEYIRRRHQYEQEVASGSKERSMRLR